jgi:hypothetical protein
MSELSKYTRRDVIRFSAKVSAMLTAGGLVSACSTNESNKVCADPNEWNTAETGLRKANAYVEISPYSDKTCLNCAFFTSAQTRPCGQCTIFNGPASETAHCNSWSEIRNRISIRDVS